MKTTREMSILWRGVALLILAGLPMGMCGGSAHAVPPMVTYVLSEFQPDIEQGGRANTIAVHPVHNDIILVATESGGLFRSDDRGSTWQHVASLPQHMMGAVAFVPAQPDIVIATTTDGFSTDDQGGIWRSTDGGMSWMHVANPPAPVGTRGFSATEISIASDSGYIFVATSYGISISTDRGATWTTSSPFRTTPGQIAAYSILALPGNRVLAGGATGVRISLDNGGTWTAPTNGPSGFRNMHAFAASPYVTDQAYLAKGYDGLWYTEDGGSTWTQIAAAPSPTLFCGGIPFIKVIGHKLFHKWIPPSPPSPHRSLDLYYGNSCSLSKLAVNAPFGSTHFDYSGAWVTLDIDHIDTRDLAFGTDRKPLLLGTDGGLHKTEDGGQTWKLVGGGSSGYHALQVMEVRGQWITLLSRYDLYFGTQDNHIWSSPDMGTTWKDQCCEGNYFESQHTVATEANSQITFAACGFCVNKLSGPVFSSVSPWPDPPNNSGSPKFMGRSFHVQNVYKSDDLVRGLAVTYDLGATWKQYAAYTEDPTDLPKASKLQFLTPSIPGVPQKKISIPVLYQAIRTSYSAARRVEIKHLVRVRRRLLPQLPSTGPDGVVTYPAMNNFGGIGTTHTPWGQYQVFAVDPADSAHLIAPDIINDKMMETRDGGDNWSEIPALTALVTRSGQFRFTSREYTLYPHASAISFSPEDPNMVAVGTWEGGILLSWDNGATWAQVPNSDQVTSITALEWRTPNDLIVSTYGRGLWRLKWTSWFVPGRFHDWCRIPDCFIDQIQHHSGPDPAPFPPFTHALLVNSGRLQGARTSEGVLRELFVTPGSTVTFFSESPEIASTKVTESRRPMGLIGGPQGNTDSFREGTVLVGLLLDKKSSIVGAVLANGPLAPAPPARLKPIAESPDQERIGTAKSPTVGKPYIELSLGPRQLTKAVRPGKTIELTGRDFKPGLAVQIEVDGVKQSNVRIGKDGKFVAKTVAPAVFGRHQITVTESGAKVPMDGTSFVVRPGDVPED